MKVSVIIPALNEEDSLAGAVSSIGNKGAEVIVADGGSSDGTIRAAERLGARVIRTGRGRGLQMDEAALIAVGGVLLFLHADTRLPAGWFEAVEETINKSKTVGGAFSLRIDSERRIFRLHEKVASIRCRLFGLIYGDQAIFVKREAFFRAGGFRKLPLMEDVDCVKRLRRLGQVALLDLPASTSPRKWDRGGIVRNTLRNWCVIILYWLGVSPDRLYRLYYSKI